MCLVTQSLLCGTLLFVLQKILPQNWHLVSFRCSVFLHLMIIFFPPTNFSASLKNALKPTLWTDNQGRMMILISFSNSIWISSDEPNMFEFSFLRFGRFDVWFWSIVTLCSGGLKFGFWQVFSSCSAKLVRISGIFGRLGRHYGYGAPITVY